MRDEPQSRLELHKCRCRILIGAAALGLIGSAALAGPEIVKGDSSPWSTWLSGNAMTGDWGGLRTTLQDHGVNFFGSYEGEGWGNTTGGLERGAVYTGLLTFGLSLDLGKAVNWSGANLKTTWYWPNGRNPSGALVGNFLTVSGIAAFNTLRAYELWFQQNWLNDAISLRLGQIAADTDFVISDYGATFLNSTFGWPSNLALDLPAGGPNYPVGTLGIRLALKPVGWFMFQAAAFQGNVYAQNVNLHGFRWRLTGANGAFFLNEAQFRWNQRAEEKGPQGQFKAGAWFHTARFAELGGGEATVRGNYGWYFILDQMLWPKPESTPRATDGKKGEPDAPKPDQGLAGFVRIAYEPQDRNFIGFYSDTGLTYKGPIPTRDNDILGAAFAYAPLSSGAKRAARAAGAVAVSAEMALEVTYQAQITPWLSVQPDLQYIINPTHPGANQHISNALVLGGHVTLTF
jgi:porin